MKRMFSFLMGCAGVCAVLGTGYEDSILSTTDGTVQTRALPSGEYVYIFTNAALGNVSITAKSSFVVQRYLVVGGGGAGGWTIGGGGGGGGVVQAAPDTSIAASETFSLTVGAGGDPQAGASGTTWPRGLNGGASSLTVGGTTVTAPGGGGGGGWNQAVPGSGVLGSVGGCACANTTTLPAGTTYTGNLGGSSYNGGSNNNPPGGGGGAGGAGVAGSGTKAGNGGAGLTSDITGESVDYAAGGGGGGGNAISQAGLAGGASAAKGGAQNSGLTGDSAPTGFGGGGGGGSHSPARCGGFGGAGTVILRVMSLSKGVLVVANGDTRATGTVVPAYGSHSLDPGDEVACSAENHTNAQKIESICTGYTLETYDADTGTWSEPVLHAGTTYAYTQSGTDVIRLTWQWSRASTVDWVELTESGASALVVSNTAQTAFSAWYGEKGLTLADVCAFDEIHYAGTAAVQNDVDLTSFAGHIRIRPGAQLKITDRTQLGKQENDVASAAYVEAGGQLYLNLAGITTKWLKHVYIAGDGLRVNGVSDGKGALYQYTKDGQNWQNQFWPTYIHLTADAKIVARSAMELIRIWIDVAGHDLTATGRNTTGNDPANVDYLIDTIITNSVPNTSTTFYCDTGYLFQGGHVFYGDSSNTFRLHRRSSSLYSGIRGNSVTSLSQNDWTRGQSISPWTRWTLAAEAGSLFCHGYSMSWPGPVYLEGNTGHTLQNLYAPFVFYGKVSGPGGFDLSTTYKQTYLWFRFCNTTNDFTGGIAPGYGCEQAYGVIEAPYDQSIPGGPAAGPVIMSGGHILFSDGQTYTLPDYAAVTAATNWIAYGSGAWRTVTQKGAGVTVWRTEQTADVLDVQRGVFRLAAPNAGLYSCDTTTDIVSDGPTVTNKVAFALMETRAQTNFQIYNEKNRIFRGYLWNRTDATVTWSLVMMMTGKARFLLDGNLIHAQTTTPTALQKYDLTLTPGPHAFELRLAKNSAPTQGTKDGTGNFPWDSATKGFVIDKQHRDQTKQDSYTSYLEDAGDGAVFTFTTNVTEALPAMAFTPAGFNTLVATNNAGVFDLCGNACTVTNVVGAPTVTNMSPDWAAQPFTVARKWTVATRAGAGAKRVPLGTARIAGALVLGTDAAAAEIDADAPESLDRTQTYVLAEAASVTAKGRLRVSPALGAANWHVAATGTSLVLYYSAGTSLIVR